MAIMKVLARVAAGAEGARRAIETVLAALLAGGVRVGGVVARGADADTSLVMQFIRCLALQASIVGTGEAVDS